MDNTSIESLLTNLPGLKVLKPSVTRQGEAQYFLVDTEKGQRQLTIIAPVGSPHLADFSGHPHVVDDQRLLLCPLTAENAAELRKQLDWLRPATQGLRTGIGLGDRLGLATPGHLRAVHEAGGYLVPFPAQQSMREMSQTNRTSQQVMDDAMWGVFAEGWRSGFGADADHLKTPSDIDHCLATGYTFYTFDPGDYIESSVDTTNTPALRARFEALPWPQLADNPTTLAARYLSQPTICEEHTIRFDELTLMRAAVKYGRAIAHLVKMYLHLEQVGAGRDWEVEISVDETETPTTHAEHVYIATELRRLGVRWVSLAPRYIGRFEKGVDYIGDVSAFEKDMSVHAAIASTLGPYKLGLHSSSDKFSIYEAAARQTRGMVHLKTAGTSYLEALRTIARLEPDLLRSIYTFARSRYETDRAGYHVSAQLDRAPASASLSDAALPTLLEQFDAREILHVTLGSVLTAQTATGQRTFYPRIIEVLRTHSEAYAADLQAHFQRHLRPFAKWSASA